MSRFTAIPIVLTRFLEARRSWLPPSAGESPRGAAFPVEFHIRKKARTKYAFDETLYGLVGNVVFANFRAVRAFSAKLNAHRPAAGSIRAGQLNAMGLIDEIFHYLLRSYEETANPGVFSRAVARVESKLGPAKVAEALALFCREFPPGDVHRGKITAKDFLGGAHKGKPHREFVIEEMILLSLANANPAFEPFAELFEDSTLRERSAYAQIITALEEFFRSERPFGPGGGSVLDLLRAPMRASPHSLEGQLSYIRHNWGLLLGDAFLRKILGAGDLIGEESKATFGGAPGPAVAPSYRRGSGAFDPLDPQRFTDDLEWMPNVVLIAKNAYVWLHQLSVKYGRAIARLDQIPDEELEQLARWHFTGLWLIGVWERSTASQRIKQIMGNPEAAGSAYSLYDYEIAHDLGGEEAFGNLAGRAWARGIRLAGDMVPNHVGIYSKWVVEHPEYFIQTPYSPYPNYRFTGENLSHHPDVDIRIEDGYWERRDAAVVFRRTDTRTGETRYIYHGNDGTNMPWNDTAQLDFLKAEVREAVIGMIFHTAQKFSIIRFDAAMVLAKRHFQRLWYPQPGTGGAIPSRAEHALMQDEFNRLFPHEFWREVVDRINRDLPSTLLLAEAFWLLEGYFVRTLGMHRVYNSAFMHMLAKEDNAGYRRLIRNTLHYNPEILKRYVNFMSNPDEETAIAQFGKDDKYFGVALLLATLPGLPMFGHGQVEGYTEKYGMEYKRSYREERPDDHLVRRHEHEIFPLLRRRHLFSQVDRFEMYDFFDESGRLNENVFAYSNVHGGERALVCYHNKYEETAGWIAHTCGKTTSTVGDEEGRHVVRRSLGEALALRRDAWYIFTDHRTGLEYLRSGAELCDRGLFVSLKAFQAHVFLDFREAYDDRGLYGELAASLGGSGVRGIGRALRDLELRPLHDAFACMFGEEPVAALRKYIAAAKPRAALPADLTYAVERFYRELHRFAGPSVKAARLIALTAGEIAAAAKASHKELPALRLHDAATTLLAATIFRVIALPAHEEPLHKRFDLIRAFERIGGPDGARLVAALTSAPNPFLDDGVRFLDDEAAAAYLGIHAHDGIVYYAKERMDEFLAWEALLAAIPRGAAAANEIAARSVRIRKLSDRSGYRVEIFRELMSARPAPVSTKVPL